MACFNQASKDSIARMTCSGEQFLMPLQTKCEALRGDLNRLNYSVIAMGARDNSFGQLSDSFSMKRIHRQRRFSDQGEQPRSLDQCDPVDMVALVVFQDDR
jgi:hypothetical protein